MEFLKMSFLIKAIYDVFPTSVNLYIWESTTFDQCRTYGITASLKYIPTRCEYALKCYTWRYNEDLVIFAEGAKICCETTNKALNNITNRAIHFVKEVIISKLSYKNKHRSLLLDGCTDWHVATDLEHHFVFPTEVTLTTQRQDIVFWFVKFKSFRYRVNGPFWRKFWPGTSA